MTKADRDINRSVNSLSPGYYLGVPLKEPSFVSAYVDETQKRQMNPRRARRITSDELDSFIPVGIKRTRATIFSPDI
jgi:hypothetical protein